MYLLDVIPIARGIAKETLSYFSSEKIEPGSIVFVPLRKRAVPALVLVNTRAVEAKTRLRTSTFALRRILRRKSYSFLTPAFMKAATETACYFGTTTGAVLHTMLPQPILESISKKSSHTERGREASAKATDIRGEKVIFQAETNERMSRYKSLIRESFAQQKSIVIIVPTIVDTEQIYDKLSRGIGDYAFFIHSGLTKKEMRARWNRAESSPHPILIVGTPSFVSLFRNDIKTIIIEHEHSRSYKRAHRPYLDTRIFIEKYAEAQRIQLIFADLPLRVETLYRYKSQELHDIIPPKFRLLASSETRIIDMRDEEKKSNKGFTILSTSLKQMLEQSVAEGGHTFLFVARRGIAPMTVCRDCGSIVMSEDKTTPMVLQKTEHGNAFISHRTGEMRSAHERCRECKSWRLETIGIGIERCYDALSEFINPSHIFEVSKDKTATHRRVLSVVQKFYTTPGSILIGTELVLPYLTKPFEHSGVISADALLSLPEWRIPERVFSLILTIRELSTKTFLIQTRKKNEKVFEYATVGNLGEFYRDEIALREEFGYPPFSILIKLSTIGTPARVQKEMDLLKTMFADNEIYLYPAGLSAPRGREIRHALLRIPQKKWPNNAIIEKLHRLPPHIAIDIDPEN